MLRYRLQPKPMNSLPPIPATEDDMNKEDLGALLERFDPRRHGGEAMAFAPVGREIGSPDYERFSIAPGLIVIP